MPQKPLTLASLGGGELEVLVNREVRKVCENIADPAVETEGTRTINIKIKIKPDKKGQTADITYSVDSKLQPVDAGSARAYIAMDPESKAIALFGIDVRQAEMFKEPLVTEIRATEHVPTPATVAPAANPKPKAHGTN